MPHAVECPLQEQWGRPPYRPPRRVASATCRPSVAPGRDLMALQPANCRVMHTEQSGNAPATLAGIQELQRLGLLVLGELRPSPHAPAIGLGRGSAVLGS